MNIATALALGFLIIVAAPSEPDRESGSLVKEPPVPSELLGAGTVYHTLSGREAQVVFTSKAPVENIVGKSNRIVGYVVAGPEDHPVALAGAKWILPVRSLATGIPLRDGHMCGDEWLDAKDFPEVSFDLKRVEAIRAVKQGPGFNTWDADLVGDMTLHGVTRELRVRDARISFLQASESTRSIAEGDLLFIKCEYVVELSDFGIRHKDVPGKVASQIRISQMLRMTSSLSGVDREE
jgi:polyisoprenoid-binding protein YceI